MITREEAEQVANEVGQMLEFQYPIIGITKFPLQSDGEWVVAVNFIGDKPEVDLPDRIQGVKIVYCFNCGKVVALKE